MGRRLAIGGLVFLAALLTMYSIYRALGGTEYLAYVAQREPTADAWAVLSGLEVAFAVVGIVGVWLAFRRRAYVWALLFLAIQLPAPLVIEASRCHVSPVVCNSIGWAALPPSAFNWEVRIRAE